MFAQTNKPKKPKKPKNRPNRFQIEAKSWRQWEDAKTKRFVGIYSKTDIKSQTQKLSQAGRCHAEDEQETSF